MSKKFWKNIIGDVLMLVVAVLTGLAVSKFVFFRATVDGSSMEPTYYDGDVCFALVQKQPSRGDVVIVEFNDIEKYLIKRVIGIPGDTVQIVDSKVYIDGVEYCEEYISANLTYSPGVAEDEIVLGVNEYFVLGDNRLVSRDSRSFGQISKAQIKGVVID